MKREKRIILCLFQSATLLMILILLPASSHAVVGAIEIIAGQEGEPVPEVTISLFQQGELVKKEETDNNGMAMIIVEEGDYRIVLNSPNKTVETNISVEPQKMLSLTGDFSESVITTNQMPVGRYRPIDAASAKNGYSVNSADLGGVMSYQLLTPEGLVYLAFPYYTSAGETISWSALLMEQGRTASERTENQKKIRDYGLRVNDKIYDLKGTTRWTMTSNQTINIALLSENGKKIHMEFAVRMHFRGTCQMSKPLVSEAGWPVCIPGEFDGNAANTSVQMGGDSIEVKAETSTSVIINPPSDLVGLQKVAIKENGKSVTAEVRNIWLEMHADKTDLLKGERTKAYLNIHGVEDMDATAYVHLYNRTPSVVSMTGGNAQFFIINPGDAKRGKPVSHVKTLVGIRRGSFTISADLHAK